MTARILLLPGWLNSGPTHWQSLWERKHGDLRVEQSDWEWPRRGDWMSRLEEVVLASADPLVLAAHSLGCQLVAAWAAHSRCSDRVRGALLVAPPDIERGDTPVQLVGWRPIVRQRLPFPSIAVISTNDPFCGEERGRRMALDWGSCIESVGSRGHINGDSGLADWPQGRAWLESLRGSPAEAVRPEPGTMR